MKVCPICFHELEDGITFLEYFFSNDVICGNCRQQFIENKRVYEYKNIRVHAFYLYDDFMENLLFQYKEARDIALKDIFLWKKKEKVNDIFRHAKCVIMPSSIEKVQERGFHHLEKMLECCDIQLDFCLKKTKNYKQSKQRSINRMKISSILEKEYIPSGKFYLFDDVVTTGNTLMRAASLLSNDEIVDAYVLSVHPHFVELCDKEML